MLLEDQGSEALHARLVVLLLLETGIPAQAAALKRGGGVFGEL